MTIGPIEQKHARALPAKCNICERKMTLTRRGTSVCLVIPAIVGAVQRYGRQGEEHIRHEIETLKSNIETWELLTHANTV